MSQKTHHQHIASRRLSERSITSFDLHRRGLWVALFTSRLILHLGVAVVPLLMLGHTTRAQSQLMHKQGNQLTQHFAHGFLTWEVTETSLPTGKKRLSGVVVWNETSGSEGEPVIGLPVELYRADPAKGQLTRLQSTVTDERGRFTIEAQKNIQTLGLSRRSRIEIMLGGVISRARNIPLAVWTTLESQQRPPKEIQLAKQLAALEARINQQTAYGQRVTAWLEKQGTIVVVDPTTLAPARYSVIDDTIHINPQQDQTLEEKITALRQGYLNGFILRLHEELHRAIENRSKWGELWRFLRETHQMDIQSTIANNRQLNEEWIRLDHALTGHLAQSPIEATTHIAQWRAEMHHTQPERQLIKEICAYWISDVLTVNDLYHQLYERDLHGAYASLYRVDQAQLAQLCQTMDDLVAAFDGDWDAIARCVGNADSLADFETQAQAMIATVPGPLLKKRRDPMWREKLEWKETTQRLAREILGQPMTAK